MLSYGKETGILPTSISPSCLSEVSKEAGVSLFSFFALEGNEYPTIARTSYKANRVSRSCVVLILASFRFLFRYMISLTSSSLS